MSGCILIVACMISLMCSPDCQFTILLASAKNNYDGISEQHPDFGSEIIPIFEDCGQLVAHLQLLMLSICMCSQHGGRRIWLRCDGPLRK